MQLYLNNFFETWVQIFIGPIAMLYRILSQNGAIKVVLNFVIFDAKKAMTLL